MDSFTNVLSLCSGGGGLDLGFRLAVPGARTVCYVENEVTACGVLAARMEEGKLDDAPIWTDLRSFNGSAWRGVVDCVIGGYPCQPFSRAGRRLGADDPRHLWPSVSTIVRDVQPEWCFFENVGAHLRLGFPEVARDLHEMGYQVAAGLFTASEVGAPHNRERLFILASNGVSPRIPRCKSRKDSCQFGQWQWAGEKDLQSISGAPLFGGHRFPQPILRRVDDGMAEWVGDKWIHWKDQIHILGNGVVPNQAAHAFNVLYRAITEDL